MHLLRGPVWLKSVTACKKTCWKYYLDPFKILTRGLEKNTTVEIGTESKNSDIVQCQKLRLKCKHCPYLWRTPSKNSIRTMGRSMMDFERLKMQMIAMETTLMSQTGMHLTLSSTKLNTFWTVATVLLWRLTLWCSPIWFTINFHARKATSKMITKV